MKAYGKTDVGVVRTMNQDYLFYSMEPVGILPNLFIVADGLGGHKAGDYASRLAVESFVKYVREAREDAPIRVVDEAIHYINSLVIEAAAGNEDYRGMGTTFVVCFIIDQTMYVANIGDSRLYLIDNEGLTQVTEDHSYVGMMVRAGELTKEEAEHHPDKNIITRAIGVAKEPKADFFEVELKQVDRILMCSDGLSNMVPESDIFEIFSSTYIGDVTEELIKEAKENGGLDNITTVVIEPFDEEVHEC